MSIGNLQTEADLERFIQARTAEVETRVRQLQGRASLTDLGLACGTNVVTITGGTSSNSAAIAHGLSGVPSAITCTARETGDTRDDYFCVLVSRNATTFVVSIRGSAAEHAPIAGGTVVGFDWIAVL